MTCGHDNVTKCYDDVLPAVSAELDAKHTELSRVTRHQLQIVMLAARVIRGVIT